MIGRTISHYRITEKLGEGAMGVVYKAEDTQLRRTVALKFLAQQGLNDSDTKARLIREAQTAAALEHPNICPVHGIHEENGETFIAMAYIDGESLADKIKQRPLTLEEALNITIQIGEGLQEAHDKGVVHRDIKLANIMLTRKSRVKIMDFGLAYLAGRSKLTKSGTTLGTPIYMSPEQALGQIVDRRSDIWSLGVVLYEMLAGKPPFDNEYEQAIIYSIINEAPEPLTARRTGLPLEIDRIISKVLAKEREERYQHVDELLVDLGFVRKTLQTGQQEAASAKKAVTSSTKVTPMRRWRIGVVIAVLLAALAGTYLSVREDSQAPLGQALQIRPVTSFEGIASQVTWSPDGRLIAYQHNGDVYVMPTSGGNPIRVTDHPASEGSPRWSPDGRYLAFTRGLDIYLIPPLGGAERKLTEPAIHLGATPWSPDGRELLFSRKDAATGHVALWKVNLETLEEIQFSHPPPDTDDNKASWSFDGEWIVVERWPRGRSSLWLLPANGGEGRLLLADQHDNRNPAWSADSRRIVFSSDRGGFEDLWEIEVETGRLRQLTTGARAQTPVISPNGGLAYFHGTSRQDLYRKRLGTGAEERLTFHGGANLSPQFSPDGKSIIYESDRNGNFEIWQLDPETRQERNLTNHPANDRQPDWSPDGREIVFTSRRGGAYQLWVMNTEGGALRRLSEQAVPVPGGFGSLGRGPRWSRPDGEIIAYSASGPEGVGLWMMEKDGTDARSSLVGVHRFDWYRDKRHIVYTPLLLEYAGSNEIRVADLETGQEKLLARGIQPFVAPDGRAITYRAGDDLYLLRLEPPASPTGMPQPAGEPEQIVQGGSGYVLNGGFSPDGKSVVYTRETPGGDIYVIENYR